MAVDVTQSQILAKLRKQSQGSFERVKKTDEKPGGRSLPGNIKNGVAQGTSMNLAEGENGPYLVIKASCVEPEIHHGLYAGTTCFLNESEWNTYEDNEKEMIKTLKALHPEYKVKIESASEAEFWTNVMPWIMDHFGKSKPCYLFNTSNRATKNGSFNVFPQQPCPEGYQPPVKQVQNQHADKGYQQTTTAPPTKGTTMPPPRGSAPPPKTPPKPKGPPKKDDVPFKPGDTVQIPGSLLNDASTPYYNGRVISINSANKTLTVGFEGTSDTWDGIPWDQCKPATAAPEPVGIQVGHTVMTDPSHFGDNESYKGTVESLNGDTATVIFENGDRHDVPLDKLTAA